jgi:hypothetical protein
MPYFITDESPDCSGFATIKEDGEVIGCHATKQDAIDQMIAVSIAEDIEPGGERALPDNYRPALSPDVPEGRACGNCVFYDEDDVQGEGDNLKAYCKRWDAYVDGGFYCNAWQPHEDMDMEMDDDEEDRQVSLEIPVYIRTAARKGLDYYGQGLAGEGLVDRTVREARDMARGDINPIKRMGATTRSRSRRTKELRLNQRSVPWRGCCSTLSVGHQSAEPSTGTRLVSAQS